MKILAQVTIVFFICFIGDLISNFLPFPFPGSVIAMILLFICLCIKAVHAEEIQDITAFLLNNMSLLFIPSTVSIIEHIAVLKQVFFPFLFICLITTLTTFLCTAYSVKAVIYLTNKSRARRNKRA